MPDLTAPRGRSAVRRSVAYLEHVMDHDAVESANAGDAAALSDLLWAARQWADTPDPAPSERARIAEAQGMIAPGSANLETVVMAARQAREAQVALEQAKDEAQVARDADLAGWLATRRDWVSPDQVRRVRERGGGTRLAPVMAAMPAMPGSARGAELLAAARLARAMGDDPRSTPGAVMTAAAEWFELIERASRSSGAAEVIADLGATRAVLDPDGDNVEVPVAELARAVVDDRRAEAARGARLKSDRDGLRGGVARLVGAGITPESGLAEVVDLVEQLRERVAPGVPSAVGVLYAARNRLSVLEEASPELVDEQRRSARRHGALCSIGDALHVTAEDVHAAEAEGEHAGLDRDVVWHRVLADRAVEAVADRDRAQAANRERVLTAGPLALRDIARIVGVVLDSEPGARDGEPLWAREIVEAVRAVAVRAKARTTVVATALVPGPGSRESRAVSQHVLHVEPGGPDANVDLTIPWGVLDGRFGPTGEAWARVAEYVRERNAGPITDAVVESLLRCAVDTDRAVRTALVEWVIDDVDPDGAWEMTPRRVAETVAALVAAGRARLSSPGAGEQGEQGNSEGMG